MSSTPVADGRAARRKSSARNVNSSGATGHLIGISAMCTTSRPPVKAAELLGSASGAVVGVELGDAAVPLGAEHPGRLVRPRGGAGRDDEVVVVEAGAVLQEHRLLLGVDPVDVAADELDAVGDERVPAAADLRRVFMPKGMNR